jgi:cytochrome c peroxidase
MEKIKIAYDWGVRHFIICVLYLLVSCTSEVETNDERIKALHLEVLPEISFPANNSQSDAKVLLGKTLFWDPILSGQKDVACATCHLPEYGYADGLDLSIGVGGVGAGILRTQTNNAIAPTPRNASTIINTGYNGLINAGQNYEPLNAVMFWDGRKKSLESQCIGPLSSFNTMRGNAYSAAVANDSVIQRLRNIPAYVTMFNEVFGPGQSITLENLSHAIASFERSIVSNNSPYDQYVKGNSNALTVEQEEGLLLFFGKANCSACHSGPMFSDYNFYNLGIPYNARILPDSGKNKTFLFRTPTLRNATLTAPYMHSGVYATLEQVLDHYDKGVSQNNAIITVDRKMRQLRLSAKEKQAIISFLDALTDTQYDQTRPQAVPSGLNPGGNL